MVRLDSAPTVDGLSDLLKSLSKRYAAHRSKCPPGKRGPWTVETFEVEMGLENLRMIRDGRGCSPGTYTRLMHDRRGVVMSDTDAEIDDYLRFVSRASGRVLVGGLGLGCVTQSLLLSSDVDSVTVIEIDADVIELVGPHLECNRLEIIHADINEWKPKKGQKWDYGWLDIWDEICGDNWPEIVKIRRRLCRRVGNISAWCEHQVYRNR